MPAPTNTLFVDRLSPGSPIRGMGPKGQDGFFGVHSVYFQGTTGLVATQYGIPGMVATRVQTGLYRLAFGRAFGSVDINPSVEGPTGAIYGAVMQQPLHRNSGIAHVLLYSPLVSPTGAAQSTASFQPVNPATGTALKLFTFVAPVDSGTGNPKITAF